MEEFNKFHETKPFTLEEWLKDKTQVCLNSKGEVHDVNTLSVGYLTNPENTKNLCLQPAPLTPFELLVEKKLYDAAERAANKGVILNYGMNLQNKYVREVSKELMAAAIKEYQERQIIK